MSTLLTHNIGSPLEALYLSSAVIKLSDYFKHTNLYTGPSNGAVIPFVPAKSITITIEDAVITSSFLYGMLRTWFWCVAIQFNIREPKVLEDYVMNNITLIQHNKNGVAFSPLPELLRAVRRFWDTESHNLNSVYTVRNLAYD